VVVTALGGGTNISTVTPDRGAQQTEAAATQTLAAGSATPRPAPSDTPLPAPTATPLPAATDTAAPTASAEPSTTPTARPAATAAPIPHGDVIFQDDFTDPSLWILSDDSVFRTSIAAGQLTFTLKAGDRYRLIFNSHRRASDFVASVAASAATCQARDRYGLLFRIKDLTNYYVFDVDCNAQYRLAKMVNNTLTPLKDWTKSSLIHSEPGAQNELAVRAKGKTLAIYVNGVLLTSVEDETFSEGALGLYAGSGISETYTAVFEHLNVWKVK
jgi:hypothetical protein